MNGPAQRFVLVDLRIPFFRLVMFFVKAALAAIPAAIILGALAMLVSAIVAAVFGGGNLNFLMWRGG
ncbi:MAG TPA: hypothetical protein VFA53_09210 [Xanthobacteraceae bacterium]|nr:hypothetical protein [Xanthobacteraceae bacterium]